MSNLVQVINMIELKLSEDIKVGIERELYRSLSPEQVIGKHAQDFLQSDSMSDVSNFSQTSYRLQ